jgi:adenine-specific DNA-methyltransferase
MAFMEAAGLKPNKLTNIWVPFVVAATESLAVGGRMALVIPAELLQVSYAAQLRRFLTQRFGRVSLVSCNELFFAGAEQEVVLLLAEDALAAPSPGNDCSVSLVEKPTVSSITSVSPAILLSGAEEKHVCGDSEKWLKYFLPSRSIEFMRELRRSELTSSLSELATVDVGIVTGKNQFFVLRKSQVEALGLSDNCLPLISRSAHLRGAIIDEGEWERLAEANERVHLLNLRSTKPLSSTEKAYVKSGEDEKFHLGYKCSIRKPWYQVPSIWVPDGFLFRQIYDFPRFVQNQAGASSTDTIHRVRVTGCSAPDLFASTFTYLTAASAEIEGRSYGGGVLELEPTEAERLLVPTKVSTAVPLQEADEVLRTHGIHELLAMNERRVLIDNIGLSLREVGLLKDVWATLRDRRRNRIRHQAKPR